jgi:hypothetical protein
MYLSNGNEHPASRAPIGHGETGDKRGHAGFRSSADEFPLRETGLLAQWLSLGRVWNQDPLQSLDNLLGAVKRLRPTRASR